MFFPWRACQKTLQTQLMVFLPKLATWRTWKHMLFFFFLYCYPLYLKWIIVVFVSLNPSKAIVASQLNDRFFNDFFFSRIVLSVWVFLVTVFSFVFLDYCSANPFSENILDSLKSASKFEGKTFQKLYYIIAFALDIPFVHKNTVFMGLGHFSTERGTGLPIHGPVRASKLQFCSETRSIGLLNIEEGRWAERGGKVVEEAMSSVHIMLLLQMFF